MRRALLSLLGLAIAGAAVVAFCFAIYSMGRIGTCASGGPYVSARPCPPGTGLKIALIPVAILAGLLGVALYSAGGVRWKRPAPVGLGLLMWSFTFLGAAGALAYAAWGPAAYDVDGGGVQVAAIVLLVVFVPMGILPLLAAGFGGRARSRRAAVAAAGAGGAPIAPRPAPVVPPGLRAKLDLPDPAPAAPANLRAGLAMSGPASAGDVVARLERLAGLRASGAISEAEFERLKARVLSEG